MSPKTAPGRRWITALALLAFFLQGLILQTHVHQLLQPPTAEASSGHDSKTPAKPDPIDQCRLCQELAHAGAFITPPMTAGVASLAFAEARLSTPRLLAAGPVTAFAWQSRAPPRR